MGCCGEKRKKWLNEEKSLSASSKVETSGLDSSGKIKANKTFEYTGDKNLTVIGSYSGNTYFFKTKGEKIQVNYFDSFSLMAERELKLLASK